MALLEERMNTKDVVIDSNYAQLTLDKAVAKRNGEIITMIILDPDKDIVAALRSL